MHAIAQILSQALTNLGVQLPPWALPAVAIAVFVALLPRLSDNMRSGEACRAVARSRVADGEARAALDARALTLVEGKAAGLVAVAHAALDANRRDLAAEAVARLRRTGQEAAALRRLEAALAPRSPMLRPTADEELVVIEQYRSTGARVLAAEHLAAARARWPADARFAAFDAEPSGGGGGAV
jgi:hypothetical protein